MHSFRELLSQICSKGVELWIHCGMLHYRDEKGVLTPEELNALKGQRKMLIAELVRNSSAELISWSETPSEFAPLSFQQEFVISNFWERFYDAFAARISGDLDISLLERCLTSMVQRHHALRTRIVVFDAVPRQKIIDSKECPLEVVDLSGTLGQDVENEAQSYIRSCFKRWLDSGEDTYQGRVIKISSRNHLLVIFWDHLFNDYFSLPIFFRELWNFYGNFHGQEQIQSPIQYTEYALWQRREYDNWHQEHASYWAQKLTGAVPIQLPHDSEMGHGPPRGSSLKVMFDTALSAALCDLSRRVSVTLPLVVLSVIAIAISRWSAQRDFAISFTFSGRYFSKHLNAIGYFPNFLLLRIQLTGGETASDLFRLVSREYFAAIEHLSIGRPVDGGTRELLRGPFFQWFPTSLDGDAIMCRPTGNDLQLRGINLTPYSMNLESVELDQSPTDADSEDGSFPLVLNCYKTVDGIVGQGGYRADLFSEDTMLRFCQDLQRIAENVARDPDVRLESILGSDANSSGPGRLT